MRFPQLVVEEAETEALRALLAEHAGYRAARDAGLPVASPGIANHDDPEPPVGNGGR